MEEMETSLILFNKIKEFEGCRLTAYRDDVGVWTIGYGHTQGVRCGDRITQERAEELLRSDIAEVEGQVRRLGVCRTQGQLDALVSFAFNLGIERLRYSTLLAMMRSGKAPQEDICKQFGRWVFARGRQLPGLVKRRQWEAGRFCEK